MKRFLSARGLTHTTVASVVLVIASVLASVGASHAQAPQPVTTAGQNALLGNAVIIQGNRRIESGTILSYMELDANQTIDGDTLNAAVRRLFDTGLFKDVQITPAGNQLLVEVIENPSISQIAFEGNDALNDEDLLPLINLRPRLPFTVSAAEADAQAIIEIYRRTGRYGAEVEPVIIERSENRVDLVFEINEGELTGVSGITFTGNTVYSDRRLRGVIETSESSFLASLLSSDVYDPDKLELDKELLRRYYFSRGYADFTVLSATAELTPDRDGFLISFNISEGEPYAFGLFDVAVSARGLDRNDFIDAIPDDLEGDLYDATEIEEIANSLTDLAGQRGFAFVQVRPRPVKNTEDRIIDVTFDIAEGPRVFIERIDIEGNTQTLDRVVRREIPLVEGDPFDTRKIRQARTNIRGLGFFSAVELTTEQGSTEDRATLKVRVEEQSTGSLSFGLGFSTGSGPVGNILVQERNFLGRGQNVELDITAAGDTQVYDFSFTEPAFLDRDLAIGMRAFFVDDDRSDESSFEVSELGFSPFVAFPLSEHTRLSLRYDANRQDIQVEPTASAVLQADDGDRITSSVGYTITHDRRNDRIEPTSGYFLRLSQDAAGLGGDARYLSSVGSAKAWTSFFDEDIIASVEVAGAAIFGFGDDIVVTERFFLGGSNLRGFADEGAGPVDTTTGDSLGGKYRMTSRLELSFPIGLPEEFGIFGGAFVDAGTLFGLDNTLGGAIDDSSSFRVAAGALLFIATPFGPLEMSFGIPILEEDTDDTEIFRLSIGTRF